MHDYASLERKVKTQKSPLVSKEAVTKRRLT